MFKYEQSQSDQLNKVLDKASCVTDVEAVKILGKNRITHWKVGD